MIGVAQRAVPAQKKIRRNTPLLCTTLFLDYHNSGALTQIQTFAITVKGSTQTGIDNTERSEPAIRDMVKLVCAACYNNIAQIAFEPRQGNADGIGSG